MRGNNLIILLVAILFGGLAAVLARNWLVSHAQSSSTVSTVVVAASPLAFGTEITGDNVRELPWNSGAVPDGAFATKQDLLKDGRRIALTAIARNEPILPSKVTAPGQRATLSSMLDPGKRAVTVRVDDVRGVAGFIQPGDRVDVVLIRTEAEAHSNESSSDVILQSAKVLAIDQITGERTEQATIAKAVTLEVTPEDAQKILLASNVGRLSLILRQPAEAQSEQVHRITERDLSALPAPYPSAPAPAAQASAPSRVKRITIWHGMTSMDYDTPLDLARQ